MLRVDVSSKGEIATIVQTSLISYAQERSAGARRVGVTMRRPSGLNSAHTTEAGCESFSPTGVPEGTCQTLASPATSVPKLQFQSGTPAQVTSLPSGLNAACRTGKSCSRGGETGCAVFVSNNCARLPGPAITRNRLSGLNQTPGILSSSWSFCRRIVPLSIPVRPNDAAEPN